VAVQAAPVAAAPVAAATAAPAVAAPAAEPKADNLITIKSPMVGTFYRTPNPESPMFVNVGDEVKPGKVVCIIEAMKLFNEIESEISGKIVKVLVDNATPVEYDQPLFLVEPA
jgi:acetyl-CoA carboxylase biotin carboxyl carrier protein